MILLDTETTDLLHPSALGAAAQPRIIDLACIQLDPWTGEVVNQFETLLNPECALSSEITKITGYRDADLAGAPTFAEVLPGLVAFFLGENAMMSHNLAFDKGLLFWELQRLGAETAFPWPPLQLCSVQLYEGAYGKRLKLIELYAEKLGKELHQRHQAMSDVEALVEIVRAERLYELGRPS